MDLDIEVLVVQCLTDYIPHVMITLIIEYVKFQGKLDGTVESSHNIDKILPLSIYTEEIITYSSGSRKIKLWNMYHKKKYEKMFNINHCDDIKQMELLIDGRILFIFYDRLMKVFDPITWKFDGLERKYESKIITVKIISLDMIYILLSKYDETLVLEKWNIKTTKCESIPIPIKITKNRIPDNRFFFYHDKIVECLWTGSMYIIDLSSIKENQSIPLLGHENEIQTITSLPNNHLASGSRDDTIKIWDMNTYNCINTLIGHTNSIITVTMLPDHRLVSGSYDNTIKIWNWKKNLHQHGDGCEMTLQNESYPCYISITCEGVMVSRHRDKSMKFWI